MSQQPRNKVFISYSHKDKKWVEKLKTMLYPLISKGKIIAWDDSLIKTGQKWHDEIINALETAKIAVLLVSDHFLASDYITKTELPVIIAAAEKGECTICWILISHCLYKEYLLDKYQAAHDINHPLEDLPGAAVKKALAEIICEIKRIYNEPFKSALKPIAPGKKPKQIKILSITASPDDIDDFYYEGQQETMLEAFKYFDRDDVFLEMPDPVNNTLMEIKDYLENGRYDILNITAPGGGNEKGEGILIFEDLWGRSTAVTGQYLFNVLKPTPRLVILSSCDSDHRESDLMPVARELSRQGIEIVIGMKTRISPEAAIDFYQAFFKALCGNKTVKQAFQQGKNAILKGEQTRLAANPDWTAIKEYEIPQLLVRQKAGDLTREDFSDHRLELPARPGSHHFLGARYLERGFIGRRQVLRTIYKSIENKPGAVVLKGPGGIGKSTLATRAAANLPGKGRDFIVVRGETSIEQILKAISKKAASLGITGAKDVYESDADVKDKLGWFLDYFLLKHKMAIIFDNFEENQDEAKGDFRKERLKEFLWYFRDVLKNKDTFLFFSTRYRLPGFESPGITIEIPEFSVVEFRKMLGKGKALKFMDSESVKNTRQEIGGNPRALELLDQIAYQEFNQREFTWEQLKDLIPELQERIIGKQGAGDDFTPLFLDKLLGYLTGSQVRLLSILSIYRHPVPASAMAAHGVKMERLDRLRLADLSLLECTAGDEKNLYYVHRLTAGYLLKQMDQAALQNYHLRAAQYFAGFKDEQGNIDLYNGIEARWHYIQAGEWNQAAAITFGLYDYLTPHGYPQRSMELLQELNLEKMSDEHIAVTYHRMGMLYSDFGDYDNALSSYEKSLKIYEKQNDGKGVSYSLHNIGIIYQYKGDYNAALKQYEKAKETFENIGDVKSVSTSLLNIGMIHQEKGDYDAALEQYEKAKKTFENIGDIKGVSDSLRKIGIIYQYKGDYDAALKQYKKSLKMCEKIGYIKGVSSNLHHIGIISQYKDDYDEALKQYEKSLEIDKKTMDIKGVSTNLHNIGIIYQYKGNYDAALNQYEESLKIRTKIGDIKGVSENFHNIGIIYQYKGDYEGALKQYEKSLAIKQKTGDIPGAAISMHQMGKLLFQKKEFETALEYLIQAFLVFTKTDSANAAKTRNLIAETRENLSQEKFAAVLKKFKLKPGDLL